MNSITKFDFQDVPELCSTLLSPITLPFVVQGIWAGQLPSVQIPMLLPVDTSIRRKERDLNIRRVEEIEQLNDDWDGYGGYAPSEMVCGHAVQVINQLALKFPQLPSPDISPSSNGTVLFSWDVNVGEATIEIGDLNFSGYIRRSDDVISMQGESEFLGESELSTIAGCLY